MTPVRSGSWAWNDDAQLAAHPPRAMLCPASSSLSRYESDTRDLRARLRAADRVCARGAWTEGALRLGVAALPPGAAVMERARRVTPAHRSGERGRVGSGAGRCSDERVLSERAAV